MHLRLPAGLILTTLALHAQWTGSGYNAAKNDGAIVIAAADPRVIGGIFTWNPVRDGWDADADNVYHFASFRIDAGVTVRVRADKMRRPGPMVWLVQGAVLILGTLDISGNDGAACTDNANRVPTTPGPGGFPGGAGGVAGTAGQRGFGPGSGPYTIANGNGNFDPGGVQCPANHSGAFFTQVTSTTLLCNNPTYGNAFLTPLIGGSGGAGTSNFASGGAGGGALRISGDLSITIGPSTGAILARGGSNTYCQPYGVHYSIGGPGSGGAVHLQAPLVSIGGQGVLTEGGAFNIGNAFITSASAGRIRIDATNIGGTGTLLPQAATGPLVNVPLPVNPTVQLATIDGVPVTASPTGSYLVPDVTINKTTAVPLVLTSQNIPSGTALTVFVSTDTAGSDLTFPATLSGTIDAGTATVNVTLPIGVHRIYVRATW